MEKTYKSIRWIIVFYLFVVFIDTIITIVCFSDYGINNDVQLYLFHIVYCIAQMIFSETPGLFAIIEICSVSMYIMSFVLIVRRKDGFYIIPSVILGLDAIFSVLIMVIAQNFIALSLIGILSKLLISILCAAMFGINLKCRE